MDWPLYTPHAIEQSLEMYGCFARSWKEANEFWSERRRDAIRGSSQMMKQNLEFFASAYSQVNPRLSFMLEDLALGVGFMGMVAAQASTYATHEMGQNPLDYFKLSTEIK